METYLEKRDPEQNQHRFYALSVQPCLFGWSVTRRWGRIGSYRGREQINLYDDLASARKDFKKKQREKLQRGYRPAQYKSLPYNCIDGNLCTAFITTASTLERHSVCLFIDGNQVNDVVMVAEAMREICMSYLAQDCCVKVRHDR